MNKPGRLLVAALLLLTGCLTARAQEHDHGPGIDEHLGRAHKPSIEWIDV